MGHLVLRNESGDGRKRGPPMQVGGQSNHGRKIMGVGGTVTDDNGAGHADKNGRPRRRLLGNGLILATRPVRHG